MHLTRPAALALATALLGTLPLLDATPTATATPANPDNPRSSRLELAPSDACFRSEHRRIPFRDVEAGQGWCVGLGQDHRIYSMGEEYPSFPSTFYDQFGDFVGISASRGHALAVDDQGDVAAWGFWDERAACWYWEQCDDPENPVSVPPEVQVSTITQVAAGTYHDLALTEDGEVLVWGPASDELQVPAALAGEKVVRIDAGPDTAAAITDDGRLHVWGDFAGRPLPPRLRDPATNVTAVDVSDSWGLALTADDTLLAFGQDAGGQLDVPPAVRRGDVVAFAAGPGYGLVGTADGGLHRWPGGSSEGMPSRLAGHLVDLTAGTWGASAAVYRRIIATRVPFLPRVIVGRTVTATRPTWSIPPTRVVYRWERGGKPIPGARGLSYTPTRGETGLGITFVALASAPGYPVTRIEDQNYRSVELRVTVPRTVRRGQYFTATVVGLATGQRVLVTAYNGPRAYGTADRSGVARVRVRFLDDIAPGPYVVSAHAGRPSKYGSARTDVTS